MNQKIWYDTGNQKRKGFKEALDEIENNPEIRTAEQRIAVAQYGQAAQLVRTRRLHDRHGSRSTTRQ